MILAKNIICDKWVEVMIIDADYNRSSGLIEVEILEGKYSGMCCIVKKEDLKIINIDNIFSKGLNSFIEKSLCYSRIVDIEQHKKNIKVAEQLYIIGVKYEKYLKGYNMDHILFKLREFTY